MNDKCPKCGALLAGQQSDRFTCGSVWFPEFKESDACRQIATLQEKLKAWQDTEILLAYIYDGVLVVRSDHTDRAGIETQVESLIQEAHKQLLELDEIAEDFI